MRWKGGFWIASWWEHCKHLERFLKSFAEQLPNYSCHTPGVLAALRGHSECMGIVHYGPHCCLHAHRHDHNPAAAFSPDLFTVQELVAGNLQQGSALIPRSSAFHPLPFRLAATTLKPLLLITQGAPRHRGQCQRSPQGLVLWHFPLAPALYIFLYILLFLEANFHH